MANNILTPTEEFILTMLHDGEINSLFRFSLDQHIDYKNLVVSVYHLDQLGLVSVNKIQNLPGRPLTIRLRKEHIVRDLKISLAELDG